MALNIDEIRDAVKDHVRDRDTIITEAQYNRAISQGLRFYSDVYPYKKINTEPGDGSTISWALPSDFIFEFSALTWVIYPADQTGEREPTYLDTKEDYDTYKTATTTYVLRLLTATPQTGETVKYEYTAVHTISATASTLPDTKSEDRVVYAAASLCCEQISAHYSQYKSSVMTGDIVDFEDKARMYDERATMLRARSGLQSVMEKSESKFAIGIRDFDPPPPWNSSGDFVVHTRSRR